MEDDFFPDFLEPEEQLSQDKVVSPKKEKKPLSNGSKKEKVANSDNDFELFPKNESNEEVSLEDKETTVSIEPDSSEISSISSTPVEDVEVETSTVIETVNTTESEVFSNQEEIVSVTNQTVSQDSIIEKNSIIETTEPCDINTKNTIFKDEETIMPTVPSMPEYPDTPTAVSEEKNIPIPNNEPQMELSFEAALTQLELIVNKMETGNFKLEELLAAYEKGNYLTKICKDKLDKMERKVELLTKDNGTSGEWTPFDASNHR